MSKKLCIISLSISLLLIGCRDIENSSIQSPSVPPDSEYVQTQTPMEEELCGIPGSNVSDITSNLEKEIGIPKGEIRALINQQFYSYNASSSYVSPQNQNSYSYGIDTDENYQIIDSVFLIANGQTQLAEEFCSSAIDYFECCVAMSYTTADIDAACAFINKNIPTLVLNGESGRVEDTIGDAKFTLLGDKINGTYNRFCLYINIPSLNIAAN